MNNQNAIPTSVEITVKELAQQNGLRFCIGAGGGCERLTNHSSGKCSIHREPKRFKVRVALSYDNDELRDDTYEFAKDLLQMAPVAIEITFPMADFNIVEGMTFSEANRPGGSVQQQWDKDGLTILTLCHDEKAA